MYVVYGKTRTRTFRVLWALEELGLPYDHVAADPRSPEILAVSPLGKVPVLGLPDGTKITDSSAILSHLADANAGLTAPAGSPARAVQDARMHFALDSFDALLWMLARHKFVLPPEQRVDIRASVEWEFSKNSKAAEEMLGDGPYLMGDVFTIADIVLGHCIGWAITAKLRPSERLMAYLTTLQARAGYQRARNT